MDSKKIGAFIATLRKEKSLTQKELALQLNITDKAVSKWENGEGYPEITIVPALAEILDVTTDELFKGERNCPDEKLAPSLPEKTAQGEFLLSAGFLKFKHYSLFATGLSLLGLIAFFTITLSTYYEVIGFGVQMTLVLASAILFKISYDHLAAVTAKYRELYPDSGGHLPNQIYAHKALVISLWMWICSITATLPYIIFDDSVYVKSIITFAVYLQFLPLFLILGGSVSLVLTMYIRGKLEQNSQHAGIGSLIKNPIYLVAICSDIYMGLFYLVSFQLEIVFLPAIGLLTYLAMPIIYTIWQRGKLGGSLVATFLIRNIVIGFAMSWSIGRSIIWYTTTDYWGNQTSGVFVNWSKLNAALAVTLVLVVLFTVLIKHLADRAESTN